MAKLCTWFTEKPAYERCFNYALPGEYRCADHIKEVKKRARQFSLSEEMKETIRKRDNYTCAHCGGRGFEVDHIVELAEFSGAEKAQANLPSNLQVLCSDCHYLKTKEYRRETAIETDIHDRSVSARARKKRRMRKKGFYVGG